MKVNKIHMPGKNKRMDKRMQKTNFVLLIDWALREKLMRQVQDMKENITPNDFIIRAIKEYMENVKR